MEWVFVPKTEQAAEIHSRPGDSELNLFNLPGRGKFALDIQELVNELKRQRRHIDRAIVALEALGKKKRPERRNPVSRKHKASPVPTRKTGTGGQLIPFSIAAE